jgi:hypothetical protein
MTMVGVLIADFAEQREEQLEGTLQRREDRIQETGDRIRCFGLFY